MQIRKIAPLVVGLMWIGVTAPAEWFSQIEIKSEPAVDGQRDYTVKFTPARSHQCDKVVFECVYHQAFPWQDARGKRGIKVHEPVRFVYRRPEVRFVNDLDVYVSFRVPVSRKRLERIYGPKVFNKDHPVTVSRMVLRGQRADETLWSFELKTDAKHGPETLSRKRDSDTEE